MAKRLDESNCRCYRGWSRPMFIPLDAVQIQKAHAHIGELEAEVQSA